MTRKAQKNDDFYYDVHYSGSSEPVKKISFTGFKRLFKN